MTAYFIRRFLLIIPTFLGITLTGTRRTLDVVRESGLAPGRVLVDHLNEVTVGVVADSGCWMGFSIYPDTKMDPHRMVAILREHGTERMVVNSPSDWSRAWNWQ